MIDPDRPELKNNAYAMDLLEFATAIQDTILSRAIIDNPPIESAFEGTIFALEFENDTSHIHQIGRTHNEGEKTKSVEYIWDTKDLAFRRVKRTTRHIGAGSKEGITIAHSVDISEGFNEEDIEQIRKLLGKYTEAISEEDLLAVAEALADPLIDQELERGLTGDGLAAAEWIELQTYLMKAYAIKNRIVAQAYLEKRLKELARGESG
jgi:hypothetical protein